MSEDLDTAIHLDSLLFVFITGGIDVMVVF